jgi:hypothetical protein
MLLARAPFPGLSTRSSPAALGAGMVALWLSTGCSAGVAAPGDVDADVAPTQAAFVLLEHRATGDTVRTSANARLLRVRGTSLDEAALRLAGVHVDLPSQGTCITITRDQESAGTAHGVELMETGAVSLESLLGKTSLQPRQVPDPLGRVTGVLYVAASPEALPPGANLTDLAGTSLRVTTGSVGDLLTAQAQVPADLGPVRLGNQELGRGEVVLPGPSAELTWDPSDDARDLVYVDLATDAGAQRCAFADAAGRASLAIQESGSVAVHRLRRERVSLRGFETAEVRFDFARTGSVLRK